MRKVVIKIKHTTNHFAELPTARKIRRDCNKELYRAIKRMNIYVDKEKVEQAERQYAQMVAKNYMHLKELKQRKKQIDWWEAECSEKLSAILEVNHEQFVQAFKRAYLGQ